MPSATLRVVSPGTCRREAAERPGRHPHAERGDEESSSDLKELTTELGGHERALSLRFLERRRPPGGRYAGGTARPWPTSTRVRRQRTSGPCSEPGPRPG